MEQAMTTSIGRRVLLKASLAVGAGGMAGMPRMDAPPKGAAASGPVAETSTGRLIGEELRGVRAFRGIPFARLPVGPLRFRPPESPEPWSGVRDATRFGPGGPQGSNPVAMVLPIFVPETSEDCLYLNVFTPGTAGSRPVLVWIHGGGNIAGAGSQRLYDGSELVLSGDVVIVTINYRLGIFGFLHGMSVAGEMFPTSGNEALLDQVAALRWVRREIAAFGGDPANVTIAGESAGGTNIAALLGLPAARGLFHKAVMQSTGTGGHHLPRERAAGIFAAILDAAGLSTTNAGRLREFSGEALLDLQTRVAMSMGGFGPVVDGEVMPRSVYDAIENGETAGIPVIVGTVRDEMSVFGLMDPSLPSLDAAGLLERAEALTSGRGQEAVALYRTERQARGVDISPPALWTAMLTDHDFFAPAMRLAGLQSEHAPSFAYLFTWPSPIMGGAFGSIHGIDLPFFWGLRNDPGLEPMIGDLVAAEPLSAMVQDALLAFMRTGDPATDALVWPRYEPESRATLIFDRVSGVEDAPREAEQRFWERVRFG
jgi:para-nitrobenzyl esterase